MLFLAKLQKHKLLAGLGVFLLVALVLGLHIFLKVFGDTKFKAGVNSCALKAAQSALEKVDERERLEHEIKQLEDPIVVNRLRRAGWLRNNEDR